MNSWINVFLFEIVEFNLQNVIETLSSSVNEQTVFLVKFFVTAIYGAILVICGEIISGVVKANSTDSVNGTFLPIFSQKGQQVPSIQDLPRRPEDHPQEERRNGPAQIHLPHLQPRTQLQLAPRRGHLREAHRPAGHGREREHGLSHAPREVMTLFAYINA